MGIFTVSDSENFLCHFETEVFKRKRGEGIISERILSENGSPINRPAPAICSGDSMRIDKASGKGLEDISRAALEGIISSEKIMKGVGILNDATI